MDLSPKCDKEKHSICMNNSLCYLCDGERLFKRPKWMELKEKQAKRKAEGIKKKPKEGMNFEKRVQKRIQKKLAKDNSQAHNASSNPRNIACRRPNSGAIWSMPGDIVTAKDLIECKERGTVTSKGEKTFTVHKSQLEKIKSEAYLAGRRSWYLVFGFKGCNDVFVIKDFEDELALVQQIEVLKDRIRELENKLNELEEESTDGTS